MLRFQPDSLFEGLLRPLLMADPVAGLYFEAAAPDLRFAFCFIFMALLLASRRARARLTPEQGIAVLGLVSMTYVWTFVVGNGRYFVWGLAMIGPLVVMAGRLMPGTLAMRLSLLTLLGAAQLYVVSDAYQPNAWGRVPVKQNPVALDDSPLRHQPAVFLTASAQTYSILIPRFHPDARWASIGRQHRIVPGTSEYSRLQALLASPLPKYLVLPLDRRATGPQGQLQGGMAHLVSRTLQPLALGLADAPCSFLSTELARAPHEQSPDGSPPQPGFWICPVQGVTSPTAAAAPEPDPRERYGDVFAQVERRCPRFFPAANGSPILAEDAVGMLYSAADVRLMIDRHERVYFRYFRAMNPTYIGSVADVRRGAFTVPCDKLPGRYVPPWSHD